MSNSLAMSLASLANQHGSNVNQFSHMANRYSVHIFWIVTLGVFGIIAIVALTFVWHRYRKRMNKLQAAIEERRQNTTPLASAWESAAERLDTKQVLAEYSEVDELTEGEHLDTSLDEDGESSSWSDGDWKPDSDDPDTGNLDDPADPDDPENPNNQGPKLW